MYFIVSPLKNKIHCPFVCLKSERENPMVDIGHALIQITNREIK